MTSQHTGNPPFSVVSLNCKGLNNSEKRSNIFNILKNHHADIICLQETNIDSNLASILAKYWHLDATFNYFTAILINNPKILHPTFSSQTQGRILQCDFQINQTKHRIFNIYAPPNRTNRWNFWKDIRLQYLTDAHNLVVGDFNTILSG